MITQLMWTTWTSLSAVRERTLNLITQSLTLKYWQETLDIPLSSMRMKHGVFFVSSKSDMLLYNNHVSVVLFAVQFYVIFFKSMQFIWKSSSCRFYALAHGFHKLPEDFSQLVSVQQFHTHKIHAVMLWWIEIIHFQYFLGCQVCIVKDRAEQDMRDLPNRYVEIGEWKDVKSRAMPCWLFGIP